MIENNGNMIYWRSRSIQHNHQYPKKFPYNHYAPVSILDAAVPLSSFLLVLFSRFSMFISCFNDGYLLNRLAISFDEAAMTGVACDLNSRGFHVLCKATEEVIGYVKPYSITGSLPLISELKVYTASRLNFKFCLFLGTVSQPCF